MDAHDDGHSRRYDEEDGYIDFGVRPPPEDADGVVDFSGLEDEAVSAQRIVASRLSDVYTGGSMLVTVPDDMKKRTPEKRFNLARLVSWNEGDPDDLLAALEAGRLRARLSAKMGMGKSTRLPFLMAQRLDLRVLHVALSAHSLQQTSDFVVQRGFGHYERLWINYRRAYVSCMTYAEFNGHMISTKRADLFRSFDVIYMDEGFVETVDVVVAKRFLAVYASSDISIIVASATVTSDSTAGGGAAKNLGRFHICEPSVSVEKAIKDPRFFSDWVVDRTVIFLPTNRQIEHVRRACYNDGMDVRILDDASSADDEADVSNWMSGDGATIRVLVAHSRYGIGFNFPISYALIFPQIEKIEFSGDSMRTVLENMTPDMVAQMQSRTGRGIAEGSGGILFSSERTETQELNEADRIAAFVILCAGCVIPSRSGYWSAAYEIFPDGLDPSVAHQIMKVCLHPRVTAKYLAQDGRVAFKYARALGFFTQPDHYLQPSKHDLPIGHDKWPSQSVLNSAVGNVVVPILAEGEVKVILQAVSAISDGVFDIEKWRPDITFAMHDGFDVDSPSAVSVSPNRLRRIENKPLPAIPSVQIPELPWQYRRAEITDNRHGGIVDTGRFREALAELERNILDYSVTQPSSGLIRDVVDDIHVSQKVGVVESPGGSKVCELPESMCAKLNTGDVLTANEFHDLILAVRGDALRFAQSKVFDNFSHPWNSFLSTLLNGTVIRHVSKVGISSDAYNIVGLLQMRYFAEVTDVLSNSNVFRNAYKTLFNRRPSAEKIMDQIRLGRFDGIAQTENFIRRLKRLKELFDEVLLFADKSGIYLPTIVTQSQRILPIRGSGALGYRGDDLKSMPSSWSRAIEQPTEKRGRSRSTNRLFE